MTAAGARGWHVDPGDGDLIADNFHGISQTLTVLECGLELSLRQDKDAAQLRARIETALLSAQALRQRMVELRRLLDAGDPGDTSVPVAFDGLLVQLQEDIRPLADAGQISLTVRCKPALVHGNAARLRSGFFRLFEFLVASAAPHCAVSVFATRTNHGSPKVRFTVRPKTGSSHSQSTKPVNAGDPGLRIARRTFQAVGGELVIRLDARGNACGHVLLQHANLYTPSHRVCAGEN